MYGFFECSECGAEWESAKVYLKNTFTQEYYKQDCKRCDIACAPYRVEETMCSRCNEVARTCNCPKGRHSDPKKPHRSDLCEKCRSGRPCQ